MACFRQLSHVSVSARFRRKVLAVRKANTLSAGVTLFSAGNVCTGLGESEVEDFF